MVARGVTLTYDAGRPWWRKCELADAHQLRRWRPRSGGTWRLDEVLLAIHGARHSLWRAVDQEGNISDMLVQRQRDK
jgi:putative transposase